ncbi:PilZ domain-containing protein [Desulfobotulus sp. H1]|uniref:PilZ domain-containing protein n=1 Tax=Desulfobotulus pelophilus TaxID=2823377 RepID=A0ABT3NC72_9BACT|nr:PilZ domain-containing protein [Desulfobotulus pelophilus]MCW7755068.1 PilZ domain-containing protein [Desulfobotulus pelophilus]
MTEAGSSGVERRRAPRFEAKHKAIAVLNAKPVRIGQVLDISDIGLAFSYMENIEWPPLPYYDDAYLELSCEDLYLSIPSSQYRVVADMPMKPQSPACSIPMRRVSIALCDLAPEDTAFLACYRSY